MEEIRLGLEEGLDVSIYDDPELHWTEMEEIRLSFRRQQIFLHYFRKQKEGNK